jgi:hypothetical protein
VEELSHLIKHSKDKKMISNWKTELISLTSSVPSPPVTVVSIKDTFKKLEQQARELHRQYEQDEADYLETNNLEASMLSEVNRLNLLNFLRVFELEIDFDPLTNPQQSELDHPARLRREETSERLASLPSLQKYISKLKEEIILLQSDLIVKVSPPNLT